MEEDKKIIAFFIFEILGKPAKYLKESLNKIIDKFEDFEGVKILKKTVHDAKPVEDERAKDLFTSFAEVEVGADKVEEILLIVFSSLPSHVEILKPVEYKLKNFELSALLSEITKKLHQYDEITKAMVMERNMLANKIREMRGEIKIENPILGNKENSDNKKKTSKKSKKK